MYDNQIDNGTIAIETTDRVHTLSNQSSPSSSLITSSTHVCSHSIQKSM